MNNKRNDELYRLRIVMNRKESMQRKKMLLYGLGGIILAIYLWTLIEYGFIFYRNGWPAGSTSKLIIGILVLLVLSGLYLVIAVHITQSGVHLGLLSDVADEHLPSAIEALNQHTLDRYAAYGGGQLLISERVIRNYPLDKLEAILVRPMKRRMRAQEFIVDFYFEHYHANILMTLKNENELRFFASEIDHQYPSIQVLDYMENYDEYKQYRGKRKKEK